jgi:hypothetical protein
MMSKETLRGIIYEYQHGGVKSHHNYLNGVERRALIRYLISLPTTCPNCGGKGEVYVGNNEDYTIEPCVA